MMSSEFFQRMALLLGIASSAMAAEVSLPDGGKLTGEVSSMDADGTIVLVSPVSEKPLRVRGDKVTRVDFGSEKSREYVSEQKVQLRNGDVLPVSVISMADGILQVDSADLGNLPISRDLVSIIQLGLFPQRLIYSGPDDFTGWKRDEASSNSWTIAGDEFVAETQGMISRDAELPEKFILKFAFSWKNSPNLQFRFAEPKNAGNGRTDRYLLQFGGSGLGVYRESSAKSGNVPIVLLDWPFERMQNNKIDIEIRLDRSLGQLQLFVDGEMQGRYTDPVPNIPAGTGISILNRGTRESGQRIGKIKILEWDDRGDRHRTEVRGDGRSDALIGRVGERLGGRLNGIRRDGDVSVYLFKSDFQKDILELPDQEVSTVFIAGGGNSGSADVAEGFKLGLRGGGELTVSSCVFGAEKVMAKHPLLGDIQIDRAGITFLERKEVPKANPVKSQ